MPESDSDVEVIAGSSSSPGSASDVMARKSQPPFQQKKPQSRASSTSTLSDAIRDVVNVSLGILHLQKPAHRVDDSFWTLRRSLGRLEFVVLHELSFDTYMTHPHQLLATFCLDLLASWMPEEFEKFDIREQAFAILRDCHIVPEFVLDAATGVWRLWRSRSC
ncbi:unnamed protein product, partial [Mesorhabditis spiculigera]